MSHRRARLGLVTAVVTAGVVLPAVGTVPDAVAVPGTVAPPGPTVTLLTGDKVTLGGVGGASVRPAEGREHISFLTRTDEQGDIHVLPEDAVRLLSQGKLDTRLFDVTELARNGYDDASRSTLPLIVDYQGTRTPRVAGARVSRELPAVSAAAVSVERSADFWTTARNAEHVWLDGPVRMSLDRSVAQIGAPEAWAAGHTGAGTTVAVLDSGIDATHPDLSDAVVGAVNFTDSDTLDDMAGHGTHVASTVAGNGAKYRGVAPGAKLLNGKVLNDNGDAANRPASLRLSTRIDAEWTFASAHTAELTALPLLAVRFAPNLSADNAAPAGKRFTIPVYVQRNGGTPGSVGTPAVEVSYDDRATWRPATVKPDRGEWRTVVDHPRGAAFVSLRASVSDSGNTLRQTIIRAYALA